ncbi:MAG: winged helix-turn-helix transcriptional regulator [Actinobacteria bacterium]|nr:winged helix-turn-helix transcriptional regulator [Actinomycetota bacterium]
MVVNLDATLAALADPTRRQVVDLLRDGPRRAGDLARRTAMSAPAMSRHLRILRSKGLVEVEAVDADARVRVYRLRKEPFAKLDEWLPRFWDEQLASFKAHAERP